MDKGDEQIRKAIEEGQFDNLPGKGKPLNLDENPFEDPEWRMANKVLLDGGFSLPWLETDREIETALETSRQKLRQAWQWRWFALQANQPYAMVEEEWKRAVQAFCQQITEINKRIFSYNLEVPLDRFQRLTLNADREIDKICAEEPGKGQI